MHILFLTDNFPPEVNAPASRTFEHCREWVRQGHEVTVITGAPNFPKGEVFPAYENRLFAREQIDGVNVVRVWTYITANAGFLKRTLDYMSFMVTAIPAGVSVGKVDVIVATSPQLFTPCAAFVVGLLKRRPYVFELRDLWPELIRAVGAMKNSRALDWLEALELFLYRRATRIVSVTHAFKDNLVERGIPADKISVVTNGADLARFEPRPRDEVLAAQLGLSGRTVFGYVGTHGMAHALGTILRAAERMQSHPAGANVRFLFLGDGAEKAALVAEAKRKKLGNVIFLDSVPRAEVVRYWSLIDVGLIHLKRTSLFETVIPSKLFECMAMGITVLHGVAGESARIVETEGVGIVFEPENDEVLAAHILALVNDPEVRETFSMRARVAATRYDRAALALSMLAALQQAAGSEARSTGKISKGSPLAEPAVWIGARPVATDLEQKQ